MSSSERGRILTVIDNLGPGGRQRTAQNFAIGYQEAGHFSAVMTVEHGGPRVEVLRKNGVDVWVGGGDETNRAVSKVMKWNPDIIHLHSEGPPKPHVARVVETLLGGLASRIPVIESSSFGKVDYRRRYRSTDIHLLKGRWALWKWQKWSKPFADERIGVVIPNTVDEQEFYPVSTAERNDFREALRIPPTAFVFGRIGQPDRWKWSSIIFDAFRQVAKSDERAYLLLVGVPPELRSQIDSLPGPVRKRIRELEFLSSDEELRQAYSSLDAFLHSSAIGESFGMVLAEALLCGCPVITQSNPSHDNSQLELVGNMHGGIVVNHLRGMVRAMDLFLGNSELVEQLGQQGRHFIKNHYTLDQVMKNSDRRTVVWMPSCTHPQSARVLEWY